MLKLAFVDNEFSKCRVLNYVYIKPYMELRYILYDMLDFDILFNSRFASPRVGINLGVLFNFIRNLSMHIVIN